MLFLPASPMKATRLALCQWRATEPSRPIEPSGWEAERVNSQENNHIGARISDNKWQLLVVAAAQLPLWLLVA